MALFQVATQIFIVRIWVEPREIKGAPPEWRGTVEHVLTGQRRYVASLAELMAFIDPYIRDMCDLSDEAGEGE